MSVEFDIPSKQFSPVVGGVVRNDFIEFTLEQPENAFLPMLLIDVGKLMLVNISQPVLSCTSSLKAFSAMEVTFKTSPELLMSTDSGILSSVSVVGICPIFTSNPDLSGSMLNTREYSTFSPSFISIS